MNLPLKIVIADDQEIFLGGLRLLLQESREIEIVGEAANGIQLIYLVKELAPQVVVTDIEMPEMGGVEATRKLKALYPQLGIIALTAHLEDWLVVDMLTAGARGYLLKHSTKEELLTGIKAVEAGGFYFCNATSLKLAKMIANSSVNVFHEHEEEKFNSNELDIIKLICDQFSSKQIATELNLSPKTIENYRIKIFEKTGAKNVTGVVVYAIKHGLYKP
jgi:DNA-binding NarL/FixJ family response regulator